jgi:hypothetical protein
VTKPLTWDFGGDKRKLSSFIINESLLEFSHQSKNQLSILLSLKILSSKIKVGS